MTQNEFMFAILVALNLADVYTTLRVLASGGRELNLVMARFMATFGAAQALFVFKAIFLGLVYWQLDAFPFWAMALLCGIYAAVVANNIKVILGK